MRALRAVRLAVLGSAIGLLPLVSACSSDDSNGPAADPIVGTWHATSFDVGGEDVIAAGMVMTLTVNSDGTYSLFFNNDLIGSCNGTSSCTQTGDYSKTSSQLTFDAGTADETTLNYAISGNSMTLTGTIDGTPVTLILHKG
jgi:hypothetical protein